MMASYYSIVVINTVVEQIISRQERVAFIGISNWALDPAKMNRGVMVTRADPSEDELVFSAKGICSNNENDPIRKRLEPYFIPFARAYRSICEKQEREFFGLRDFYRLMEHLTFMPRDGKYLITMYLQFNQDVVLHVSEIQLPSHLASVGACHQKKLWRPGNQGVKSF